MEKNQEEAGFFGFIPKPPKKDWMSIKSLSNFIFG